MFLVKWSSELMLTFNFSSRKYLPQFWYRIFMFPSIIYIYIYIYIFFFLEWFNISAKCLSRIFSNYSSVWNILPFSSRKHLSRDFLFLLVHMPSSTPHHPHPGLKLPITSLPVGCILALVSWILFLGSLPHLTTSLLRAWWVFVSLRQRLWVLFFYYFTDFFKANSLASCFALLQKLANILRLAVLIHTSLQFLYSSSLWTPNSLPFFLPPAVASA